MEWIGLIVLVTTTSILSGYASARYFSKKGSSLPFFKPKTTRVIRDLDKKTYDLEQKEGAHGGNR